MNPSAARRVLVAVTSAAALALALPNPAIGATSGAVVVGVATERGDDGYWTVGSDGTVEAHGGAPDLGSAPRKLTRPIVGIASTPTGKGYWLVGSDGGIFTFGDARYLGSTGAVGLARPIVGMAPTPTGKGYWLAASDGGIFTFGDARYLGSTGAVRLARPIVGMAPTPTGNGYWLAASDGGIFTFGDAPFAGAPSGRRLARPAIGIGASPTGRGYWLFGGDGSVFAFGDAPDRGRAEGAVTAAAADGGYVLAGPGGKVTERRLPPAPVPSRPSTTTATPPSQRDGVTTTLPTPAFGGGGAGGGGLGGGPGPSPVPVGPTTTTTGPPVSTPPTTTTTTTSPQPPGATREAWLWPFAATSPWNTPIGSAATFAGATDARTVDLLDPRATAWVNAGTYSHPVHRASDTDPMATFRRAGYADVSYRVPAGATPAAGYDAHLHVVDPTGRWVDESWATGGTAPNFTTGYHVRTDLRGPGVGQGGVRAYGGSAIGGLVRSYDLQRGTIGHALALAIEAFQLGRGPVWPATNEDGDAQWSYGGSVPMGTLVAIPRDIDLATLGLGPTSLVLAHALQDFGAYVVDRSGSFTIYAEPSLESSPTIAAFRRDLPSLRRLLRVVTNNTATNAGGGGVPRAPGPPPLA